MLHGPELSLTLCFTLQKTPFKPDLRADGKTASLDTFIKYRHQANQGSDLYNHI